MDGRRDRNKGRRCVNFVSAAAVRQGQSGMRGTERAREERGVGISRIRSTRTNGRIGRFLGRKKGSGANTRHANNDNESCYVRAQRTNCSTDRRRFPSACEASVSARAENCAAAAASAFYLGPRKRTAEKTEAAAARHRRLPFHPRGEVISRASAAGNMRAERIRNILASSRS